MKIQFDSVIHLLHSATFGSLATQSTQMPGYPFSSILPFVPDEQHRPVFLISGLAEHTKNIMADCRASFLVHSMDRQNVLMSERASLLGDMTHIDASPELVARYLRYQPDAEQYLTLGDFAFFRFTPKGARYIVGFGKMGWAEETDWTNSAVLSLMDEVKLIHELMEVKAADTRLLGLDCYGFDAERAGVRRRLHFPNGPISVNGLGRVVRSLLFAE